MIFLLENCVKFRDIFINSYFFHYGYNKAFITDYEELLFSLDQTVSQLSTTLSLRHIYGYFIFQQSSSVSFNIIFCAKRAKKIVLLHKFDTAGEDLGTIWLLNLSQDLSERKEEIFQRETKQIKNELLSLDCFYIFLPLSLKMAISYPYSIF